MNFWQTRLKTFQSIISTPRTGWILMNFGCILVEFWLHFDWILTELFFLLNEFWLNFNWILIEFWLYFGCILAAFSLNFDCFLTAFWLHFNCTLTEIWVWNDHACSVWKNNHKRLKLSQKYDKIGANQIHFCSNMRKDKTNNNFGLSRKILRERHFFFVNTQQSGFYISSYFNTPQYQPQASDEPLTCNGFLSVEGTFSDKMLSDNGCVQERKTCFMPL